VNYLLSFKQSQHLARKAIASYDASDALVRRLSYSFPVFARNIKRVNVAGVR